MDKLFLLNPNFEDDRLNAIDQLYYCPYNAMIEGLLKYYPKIKEQLEITYINFERPRKPIVALIGEENQGTPVLVIERKDVDLSSLDVNEHQGKKFIHGHLDIAKYLAEAYGVPLPHP